MRWRARTSRALVARVSAGLRMLGWRNTLAGVTRVRASLQRMLVNTLVLVHSSHERTRVLVGRRTAWPTRALVHARTLAPGAPPPHPPAGERGECYPTLTQPESTRYKSTRQRVSLQARSVSAGEPVSEGAQ